MFIRRVLWLQSRVYFLAKTCCGCSPVRFPYNWWFKYTAWNYNEVVWKTHGAATRARFSKKVHTGLQPQHSSYKHCLNSGPHIFSRRHFFCDKCKGILFFSLCGRPREGGCFEGLYKDANVFLKGWKALEGFESYFGPPVPESNPKTTQNNLKQLQNNW